MANGEELTQAVLGPGEVPPGAPLEVPPVAAPDRAQPGVMPPKDDAELQQRVTGWRAVMDRLAKDPVAQMALFRFGTQMMRPVQPGQTNLGHVAGALDVGATTAQLMQQEQTQQQTVSAETARRAKETEAQVKVAGAQVPRIEAETRRLTQMLEPEIENLRARTRQAQTAGDLQSIEADIKQVEARIAREFGQETARLKMDEIRASIGYKEALSEYARAHAKQARAMADAVDENWQVTVTKDPEGNATDIVSVNRKSGERQVTRISPPMPYGEAVAKAKSDLKSASGRIAGFWGGGEPEEQVMAQVTGDPSVTTQEQAMRVLTDRYVKGGATTLRFNKEGKPMGAVAGGGTDQIRPAAPATPQAQPGAGIVSQTIPVPANMRNLPPGTKLQHRNGTWYEVTPNGLQPTTPPENRGGGAPTAPVPPIDLTGMP